jgi:hypothetical protein
MWWLLWGCANGVIHTPQGSSPIRAAYYSFSDPEAYPYLTEATILLANSDLDCELPAFGDHPETVEEAQTLGALTREGARVVVLRLFQLDDEGWTSRYDLQTAADGEGVTTNTGVASAAYLAMNEAAVVADGLIRTYDPGPGPDDCSLLVDASDDGFVEVKGDTHGLRGSFSLDDIDVSGRFRADECREDLALAVAAISTSNKLGGLCEPDDVEGAD